MPPRRPFDASIGRARTGLTMLMLLLTSTLALSGCDDSDGGDSVSDTGDPDPAEVAIGERLFLETRFAQFFAVNSGGDANTSITPGDPVLEETVKADGPDLPGPFAGKSINCRACHLVDEQLGAQGGGMRTYADFAQRSPLPERGDRPTAVRNSPALVNASLPREDGPLFHFDGEFASLADLVKTTLTGRMMGWLPGEADQATAHIAHIIRHDDGSGDLAQEFGGAYSKVLTGTDLNIPGELRLPAAFRVDVATASDDEILDAVARLIAAYVSQLEFSRNEAGAFNLSPFDAFLDANDLPRQPAPRESNEAYGRRLLEQLNRLTNPVFIGGGGEDQAFTFHDHAFRFGPPELRGLKVFLSEPLDEQLTASEQAMGGIGNCIACHAPPTFTDSGMHNTGIAQNSYDAIHGEGGFMALEIPDLATRNAKPDAYLPRTQDSPSRPEPFRSTPDADHPARTDLGVWNIFANPAFPNPEHQARLRGRLCAIATSEVDDCGLSDDELLTLAIGSVKAPGLRDLGHSDPFMHDGSLDDLQAVLQSYQDNSDLARAGDLRSGDPEMARIALSDQDVRDLVALLRALDEDYE